MKSIVRTNHINFSSCSDTRSTTTHINKSVDEITSLAEIKKNNVGEGTNKLRRLNIILALLNSHTHAMSGIDE